MFLIDCNDYDTMKTIFAVKNAILLVCVLAPLILIVVTMVSAFLKILNGDENPSKMFFSFLDRFIGAAILFMLPSVISILFMLFNKVNIIDMCWSSATSSNMKSLKAAQEQKDAEFHAFLDKEAAARKERVQYRQEHYAEIEASQRELLKKAISSGGLVIGETTNTFISKENCPNAYNIYKGLVKAGFSDVAAAAMLGNFFQESGGSGTSDINPTASGSGYYGIAQFEINSFTSWMSSHNKDQTKIDAQIEYLKYTLEDAPQKHWWTGSKSEQALLAGGYLSQSYTYEDFKDMNDLSQATAAFLGYYEECIRANTTYTIDGKYLSVAERADYEMNNRYDCAVAAYNAFN